jgi:hypothetical protein
MSLRVVTRSETKTVVARISSRFLNRLIRLSCVVSEKLRLFPCFSIMRVVNYFQSSLGYGGNPNEVLW